MLLDDPTELFKRYRKALAAEGVDLTGGDGADGTAGIGDAFGRLLHGAKEALRQATYWQMKNRAGTVGRVGLGPRARPAARGRAGAPRRAQLRRPVGLVRPGRAARRPVAGAGRDPAAGCVLPLRRSRARCPSTRAAAARWPACSPGSTARSSPASPSHDGAVGRSTRSRRSRRRKTRPRRTTASPAGAGSAPTVRRASKPRWRRSGPSAGAYGFAPGAALNIDASEVVRRAAAGRGAQRHRPSRS